MKNENKTYIAPQVEVIAIEIEDAVLSVSNTVSISSLYEEDGRF
ncbi:MAG: hypothetical protein SNH94_04095 [Rikenellaceae bacterium]